MTLVQKLAAFPLHRWLDQNDVMRLWFCLALGAIGCFSYLFPGPLMVLSILVVLYALTTRWAWITDRLR